MKKSEIWRYRLCLKTFPAYFILRSFQAKTILSALSAAVFVFSPFNSYSTSRLDCKRHFIKPKKVKLLPPEGIRSLSREETHSLQPKHFFWRSQAEGSLGDFRLTAEQFQALNLNDLHPETLASIASRKDVLALMAPEQIQALDLTTMPARTVLALIESRPDFDLTQKFQELDLNYWPQQDLKRVRDTLSIARHLSREQSNFIKRQWFSTSEEEDKKRQEDMALLKKSEDMEAVSDHGLFDQAIADGSFDEELIPFLRVSELNDDSIQKLVETLETLTKERKKELTDHVFGNLSNESIRELAKRYRYGFKTKWRSIVPFIRDHGALSESVDNNLFGSAKAKEELHNNMRERMLGMNQEMAVTVSELRFAELSDEVIEKIRKAVFYHPSNNLTEKLSEEQIAELIKRKGGLDALTVPADSSLGRTVFAALFEKGRLTDEIVEYALSELPALLENFDSELTSRIPKKTLKAVVFGDKSSEFSPSTFKAALKTILKVEKEHGRSFVSLGIDQVESLIRNPHIISREEFDKVIEETDRENKKTWRDDAESAKHENFYLNLYIYEHLSGRNAPPDFRDPHLALLTAYLRSLMGEFSLKIKIPGILSLVSHSMISD